jgi:membrane protein YdbS with pleckstrin-like domain
VANDIDRVFRPPGEAWHPVSPRLSLARRLVLLMIAVPGAIFAVVAAATAVSAAVAGIVLAVALALTVWAWWLIGRRVRSYGYAERAEDLLVTSGILIRRLTIVPYGRMQLVEVASGPLDRSLGMTTVKLHTASLATQATIPGLLAEESGALRDRLTARGEERSAGL